MREEVEGGEWPAPAAAVGSADERLEAEQAALQVGHLRGEGGAQRGERGVERGDGGVEPAARWQGRGEGGDGENDA